MRLTTPWGDPVLVNERRVAWILKLESPAEGPGSRIYFSGMDEDYIDVREDFEKLVRILGVQAGD